MAFDRRTMLQRTAAGAVGLAVAGGVVPVLARSTPVATPGATPEATPVLSVRPYLATAEDLAVQREDVQCVAIMPGEAFDEQRIPGSILLDWAGLELADTSDAAVASWTASMQELVAVRGIRADRPVVVYDEGTLFAARGWWQLAYLGYDPPVVLDGGLPAWTALGEPVESGPVDIFPVEAPLNDAATVRRDLLATKDEVLASLDDPDVVVVDARSAKEYDAGHIPGAKDVPYPNNATEASPHLFKSSQELLGMYAEVGVAPDKRVITYCTTGVRGSVAFFALKLAGFEDVALYVGSWNEWNADPDTPKETTQGR
jgi:thiosulfate/3-mercaptopyruvate sulfurtransferase